METGSVDDLVRLMTDDVATGIHQRFANAIEKKKHADENVEAGREFVEAYVSYVHYVERLHLDATGEVAHHSESEGTETEGPHKH